MRYERRVTTPVNVGGVVMGGNEPIRVQTMTNTATDDVERSVEQCLRCAEAGAELVRLTAQGVRQAESIGMIRNELRKRGCDVPLVADIHFNRNAAYAAAALTDGVRINPGNFVDPARTFRNLEYTDEEYAAELARLREAVLPFIKLCREHGTAVRLGVNHGSLSDRIMSRYGNTPAGMVESVMEFLRVFVAEDFDQVVISMKASNVVVMVEAVRRLVAAMDSEGMRFPLHLGVTEAGFGEDGRIKSAVGIGALLYDGLGDTIRVSLSEDPECEIPIARHLVACVETLRRSVDCEAEPYDGFDPIAPAHRPVLYPEAWPVKGPVVIATAGVDEITEGTLPDFYVLTDAAAADGKHRCIVPGAQWTPQLPLCYPLFDVRTDRDAIIACPAPLVFVAMEAGSKPCEAWMDTLKSQPRAVVLVQCTGGAKSLMQQGNIHALTRAGVTAPVVLHNYYTTVDADALQVAAGADMGSVLLKGLAEGVWLEAYRADRTDLVRYSYAILQAARLRTTTTEFISCPGCGRTLFDLQSTVKQVKQATSHLTHLKIAVMGCIVNGPGEMADADYGYVGAGPGRVSLYKGKTLVEQNIPTDIAIDHLLALIKANEDNIEL